VQNQLEFDYFSAKLMIIFCNLTLQCGNLSNDSQLNLSISEFE